MRERLEESSEKLKDPSLQAVWDLATKLVQKHGVSDDEYGVTRATWVYSSDNDALMVQDLPGLHTYGGSKTSPQLGIYLGQPYHDRWSGPSFRAEKEFIFDADKTGYAIYGPLTPDAVERVLVRNNSDPVNKLLEPPTTSEIAEIELMLGFAITDLDNRKRRLLAQAHLKKAALLSERLKTKDGKLEYIDTWLASMIEEYDPTN
jgi:hypothetical protein